MSYSLAQLRDLLLRRRVEHPIHAERDAEAVAAELRHSVVSLAALIGKVQAGAADRTAMSAWIGRAQCELVLLAQMMGVTMDAVVYGALNSRGRNCKIPLPPSSLPAAIVNHQGWFRIQHALWMRRPDAIERALSSVSVELMRMRSCGEMWEFLACSDQFRLLAAGETVPEYRPTITEKQGAPVEVSWHEVEAEESRQ